MPAFCIDYQDIAAAHERLRDTAHRTPVLRSRFADEHTGAHIFFKCENLQRIGAFKFRGAYNALSQFTPEQRSRGVVAFSSGNHAQAIALAARLLGMPAVIVMPSDAPTAKLEATRGYGAEVILYDRYKEDRIVVGERLARERELTLVPPFDHPHVIAGQGTVAKELLEEIDRLDMLVTPVGGGGLISGCAIAARELAPQCSVIGVEPENGNDGQQSVRTGHVVKIAVPNTIADGAQTPSLGEYTFPIIREMVADIVTVSDAELVDTMRFFATRMKIIVEPTGCLAAAALLSGKLSVKGKRIGVVLSGGNIDLDRFAALTQTG